MFALKAFMPSVQILIFCCLRFPRKAIKSELTKQEKNTGELSSKLMINSEWEKEKLMMGQGETAEKDRNLKRKGGKLQIIL